MRYLAILLTLATASTLMAQQKPDARALGIPLRGTSGPNNAITDVAGVEVGHTTIVRGSGVLKPGQGPVRTGVTAILPRGRTGPDSAFAAWFSLNGNGEMTGTAWIDEGGILETPILITNTHSVGVARDAAIDWMLRNGRRFYWTLPVVAETWDGALNDINGFHVKPEHVFAALDNARGGAVPQGALGGGTGMICNGFKGGIGSASRVLPENRGSYTVGVLVQCNYGERGLLRIAGVPVGELVNAPICYTTTSAPDSARGRTPLCTSPSDGPPAIREDLGSIIIVVATDAPLLPHQLERVVKRAALGIGKLGGIASNGSGDIFIAFSTANRAAVAERGKVVPAYMLPNDRISILFDATVQATEEAIINAMLAAEDMIGINDLKIPALPETQLKEIMRRYHKQ
ncbi:MAG: DmpA family aminopeptidase [Gemmatimonadota bacterium]